MNKWYEILYSHEIVQMPEAMRRRKNVILTTTIVSTFIIDALSFSITGAQRALAAGINWLALTLLILYFIREVLRSTVQTFTDDQKTRFSSQSDAYITSNVSNVSNVVRGKVFQKKGDYSLIMSNAEIIFNLKDFIGFIWTFWQNFPIVVANSVLHF